MEIQASRFGARTGPSGEPVLLLDQNRARWDQLLIRRGLAALDRAEAQAKALGQPLGSYVLQAAIAACHARARSSAETDWARIVGLYGRLAELAPSPVVELNRAVALGMLFGPAAGLELVDALTAEPSLKPRSLCHNDDNLVTSHDAARGYVAELAFKDGFAENMTYEGSRSRNGET